MKNEQLPTETCYWLQYHVRAIGEKLEALRRELMVLQHVADKAVTIIKDGAAANESREKRRDG